MDPEDVRLDNREFFLAAQTGVMRRIQAKQRGEVHVAGADDRDGWRNDIEGACGEMAVCKHLGVYWQGGVGLQRHSGDCHRYEVRTTALRRTGHLLLRPGDHDDAIFILVVGTAPQFALVGWLYGHEGKQAEYAQAPNNRTSCYMVPQSALHALAMLPT